MKGKDYLAFLNVAGAVCSILALLLTLSKNVTIALVLKSLVVIVFFIATAGTLAAFAYNLNKKYLKSDYWPYHLLYWLGLGMVILILSMMISGISYGVTTLIFDFFSLIFDCIKDGNF